MCGIAGFLGAAPAAGAERALQEMANKLAHRGPDAAGVALEPAGEGLVLGFAHRRLSILDLSPAGAQPMASADGRWLVAYNGEAYNAPELARRLQQERPVAWRGHSDTEVLTEAIARWGVEPALAATNGMFALAVWDRKRRELWLARDRMGEKPLYWGWLGGRFVFASELKALAGLEGFPPRADPRGIAAYLAFGYVPQPLSAWEGLSKLAPGGLLKVAADARPGAVEPRSWWTLPRPDPRPTGSGEAAEAMEALLTDAVSIRMRSDVPMGAFLSGGIDSSTVVALMTAAGGHRVRTFTMGFASRGHDERAHARAIARHLGTEHHDMEAKPADALAFASELAGWWDEPFADSSAIPTHLLARLTREHVVVALSGDGGDELFGGYARYLALHRSWPWLQRLPRPVRAAAGSLLQHRAGAAARLAGRLPGRMAPLASHERLAKLGATLGAASPQDFFRRIVGLWPGPGVMEDEAIVFGRFDIGRDFTDPVLGMGFVDQLTYLPEDILVKVDRATMAVGLEARVPFLDHRVVEEAARLPLDLRIAGGQGKQVLRRVLGRHLPPQLLSRPKQGFSLPLAQWLRGPLAPWAQALFDDHLDSLGAFVDPGAVRRLWAAHLAARENAADRLWTVLMLAAWRARWRPAGW